jgi:hypothetical protein
MRLYSFVTSKEELLELMADAVYAEMMAAGRFHGPWRSALHAIAHRTRKAAQAHPWFITLLAGRHHIGPNALAYLEASLGALSGAPGFEDIDHAARALRVLNAYVLGAIQSEASELRAERESGMNMSEWQQARWPYVQRVLASGAFPTLTRFVKDAAHPPDDVVFEEGLQHVLDGIAARLSR